MADDDEDDEKKIDPATLWPSEAPEEVRQAATMLWRYVCSKDLNIVGPALSMVFARMVFEAGHHTTGQEFADIAEEIGKIVIKWKAAYDPRN